MWECLDSTHYFIAKYESPYLHHFMTKAIVDSSSALLANLSSTAPLMRRCYGGWHTGPQRRS